MNNIASLPNICWEMFLLLKMKKRLQTATELWFLEKHGKYVKGKYSLTGGSVGLFEGKKIGRAKNLEKLQRRDSRTGNLLSTI